MPAISVLVPVYNALPFLEQCLNSIRNQSFTDFEVICLNDGSTDASLETLNRFAQQDKRFVVIDLESSNQMQHLGVVNLVRCSVAQAFARPAVELIVHLQHPPFADIV